MGDFKINEKTVFTQSGSAEPAMGSTITGIPAAGLTGTIPSGVSLASATFPAGHVIQVGSFSDHTTSIDFDTDVDTICTVTLTDVLASSICIVMGYISNVSLSSTAGVAEGMEMYLYRDAVNLTAGMGGYYETAAFGYKTEESNIHINMCANVKDSSPTTGTNNYYMKGSGYSATTPAITHDGTYGLTVFEIAQ